jgi:hypothetical protein
MRQPMVVSSRFPLTEAWGADLCEDPTSKAESVGYARELQIACAGLKEMHRRGIKVLPGGDYG